MQDNPSSKNNRPSDQLIGIGPVSETTGDLLLPPWEVLSIHKFLLHMNGRTGSPRAGDIFFL